MEYILLAVVICFVLFTAWRERESRLEREQLGRAHRVQTSELLTRIAHPEQTLIPVDVSNKVSTPDTDPEQDDFGMVGSIVPGLPE